MLLGFGIRRRARLDDKARGSLRRRRQNVRRVQDLRRNVLKRKRPLGQQQEAEGEKLRQVVRHRLERRQRQPPQKGFRRFGVRKVSTNVLRDCSHNDGFLLLWQSQQEHTETENGQAVSVAAKTHRQCQFERVGELCNSAGSRQSAANVQVLSRMWKQVSSDDCQILCGVWRKKAGVVIHSIFTRFLKMVTYSDFVNIKND